VSIDGARLRVECYLVEIAAGGFYRIGELVADLAIAQEQLHASRAEVVLLTAELDRLRRPPPHPVASRPTYRKGKPKQ